jgi:nitronate monooxygenase
MADVSRDDLVAELNALLEAERAGARVGAALVAEAKGTPFEHLAHVVHDDEVKWARALFEAIGAEGGAASDKVGDFAAKAMAIDGLEARLAFVNRGQGWVVRKLRELTPKLDDGALKDTLQAMLDAHVVNIAAANDALAADAAGPAA